MTFAALNSRVVELRKILTAVVAPNALEEIVLTPPRDDSDELSFLRLVAWTYSLMYEVGRISIPFCCDIQALGTNPQPLKGSLVDIQRLRTWAFHNLGLEEDHDLKIVVHAHHWFLNGCGNNPPTTSEEWRKCFHQLCTAALAIVEHCLKAASYLTHGEDQVALLEDLKYRLARNWEAYRFDELVESASRRLGIPVDVRRIRDQNLSKWRKILLAIPSDQDPALSIVRAIERDLLDHARQLIPLSSQDIIDHFGVSPGAPLVQMLRRTQVLFEQGCTSRQALLSALAIELGGEPSITPAVDATSAE